LVRVTVAITGIPPEFESIFYSVSILSSGG